MKPLLHILLAFALITQSAAFGQTTFQKAIGGTANDQAYDLIRAIDGAYVAAGETVDPNTFDLNMFLVKFTAQGDTVWTRSIGADLRDETAASIRQTSDGGFVLCGTGQSFGPDASNIVIVKTDDEGAVSWTKTFGASAIETGKMAQQTADGGYIVLGTSEVIGAPSDICLIKTDPDGDTTWTRILSVGPDCYDVANAIVQTNDGGYLITGVENEPGVFGGMSVIRTDANGDVLWAKCFNGSNAGYSMKQTSDGGCVVLGTHYTTNFDLYLAKLDAQGDTSWTRSFGGTDAEDGASVVETNDGGFIIAGGTRSFGAGLKDAYLVRTDVNGDLSWSRAYGIGNFDLAFAARSTDDGGFMAVGQTNSFGPGQSSMYVIRTDASGNSGCNDVSAATTVQVPAVTVTDVVLQSWSGIAVSSPVVTTRAGSMVATACLTTNVQEIAANNPLLVFPNPTSGLVVIRTPRPIHYGEYELTDLGGKVVAQGIMTGTSELLLPTEGLAPGSFIVRIVEAGSPYYAKLFVEPN